MIVYQLDPIDTWFGWTPLEAVLATISKPPDDWMDACGFGPDTIQHALVHARQLAKLLGDNIDDLREGPYFCPLPENDCCPSAFLLAWKQDNNGTTYVASPYRLPWLEKDCLDSFDDSDGNEARNLGRAMDLLGWMFPHAPAAKINATARYHGIPMRSLRFAVNAKDIPWQQASGVGYPHLTGSGVKTTVIGRDGGMELRQEPTGTRRAN